MIECEKKGEHKVQVNQSQSVPYILSCLCKGQIQQKAEQKLQNMWVALKITIGNLIVRGYRTFKYFLNEQIIVFWRRQIYQTQYLFLKIQEKMDQNFCTCFFKDIDKCVAQIQKFKRKPLNSFNIVILFALDYSFLQISANPEIRQKLNAHQIANKQELLLSIPKECFHQQCFIPDGGSSGDVFISEDQNEHRKFKQILHSYIDTFGLKYKANYYKQVSKKIDYLINTLNLLIFEQTKPVSKPETMTPLYNQIQSANWSQFKKGRLESDRKDIVLTGQGKILFIDLTFAYKLEEYIDLGYQQEAKQLLFECSKAYGQGKIKVVKIENSLTPRHVYSYYVRTIH